MFANSVSAVFGLRSKHDETEGTKTIATIGGGVSGALNAFHLIRQKTPAQVIVIDKRLYFGLGLAYSRPSLRAHLLTVPARTVNTFGCGRTTIRFGDYTINLDRKPPQLDYGFTANQAISILYNQMPHFVSNRCHTPPMDRQFLKADWHIQEHDSTVVSSQ